MLSSMTNRRFFALSSIAACFSLAALGASVELGSSPPAPRPGRLELFASAPNPATCSDPALPLTGALTLSSLEGGERVTLPLTTLDPARRVQHEVEPGLYSASWLPDATASLYGTLLGLERPGLVVVQAGRVTPLALRHAQGCALVPPSPGAPAVAAR